MFCFPCPTNNILQVMKNNFTKQILKISLLEKTSLSKLDSKEFLFFPREATV